MTERRITLIMLIAAISVLSACRDDNFTLSSREKLLIRVPWIIRSVTDTENNTGVEFPDYIYNFQKDGTYIIQSEGSDTTVYGTWEIIDDGEYLRAANDTLRIAYVSRKLLCLHSGSLEFSYVPAEKKMNGFFY